MWEAGQVTLDADVVGLTLCKNFVCTFQGKVQNISKDE